MANRTVKDANSIHGTNPQYLVEKIIRTRIYESKYWKEECFGLTAELVVDKAMELKFTGGVFGGNIKPTPFLCLTLKMLQIQPEKDIIVRAFARAMYMRLTGTAVDCYKYLEPLYNDYRKIKTQNRNGGQCFFSLLIILLKRSGLKQKLISPTPDIIEIKTIDQITLVLTLGFSSALPKSKSPQPQGQSDRRIWRRWRAVKKRTTPTRRYCPLLSALSPAV
uniref:Pre-mRNA-splicing factor 38B n=1 Tax=Neogobius melanostomus TaxID=47308 RepID=A0A8C6S829_9GOBI